MREKKLNLKKHNLLVTNYKNEKQKHLRKLATKMLKKDEQFQKLKEKKIKGGFLKNF